MSGKGRGTSCSQASRLSPRPPQTMKHAEPDQLLVMSERKGPGQRPFGNCCHPGPRKHDRYMRDLWEETVVVPRPVHVASAYLQTRPANMRLSKGTGIRRGTSILEFRCEWCGYHSVSPTVVEQHEEREH